MTTSAVGAFRHGSIAWTESRPPNLHDNAWVALFVDEEPLGKASTKIVAGDISELVSRRL
ncbi:hypothetical protein HNR49_002276 [Halobacterium salinarum]|uniref:Uncharacterized protein n=1 Tax=Halobacterium salinarum TaxID=2242 RepID=A0A841HEW4_HALSI|nr:hypothetical protein [Halobacterium salinarum]